MEIKRLIHTKLLIICLLVCSSYCYTQVTCPILNGPFNGDTNVPVDTNISWNSIPGVPGYLISIGTTPGGIDIVNNINVGSASSYQPEFGLPENTTVYVTLTIFFFNSEDISCSSESFTTEDVTSAPPCTEVRFPADGAGNVNVASSIFWNYASTATGYQVSIGTTAGGNDILNNADVGNTLSFNPPGDLPFDTEIFVTIRPYNENGAADGNCEEISFTTGSLATIPGCTSMVSPADGAMNVPLTPRLEWVAVPDAIGYRVTIGMSPNTAEVIDDLVFFENSTLVFNFDPNRTFFITIIPFNEAGEAVGCSQETFSTLLGCGPYLNSTTGELVDLAPEINFQDEIPICENQLPFRVSGIDAADGHRWYKIGSNGNETVMSTESSFDILEKGNYRYEAFNTISQSGNTIECANDHEFSVITSEIATITSLDVKGQNGFMEITTQVSGSGDYEYALDAIEGPYQDSNVFANLPFGTYTIYVRDKNGCGIAEDKVVQDLTLEGFPEFFTPNGDGINDYWQFIPPRDSIEISIGTIQIFDRYGNLIKQFEPVSRGWDGSFNGQPMPSSDYWFTTISLTTMKEVKGHFALKR